MCYFFFFIHTLFYQIKLGSTAVWPAECITAGYYSANRGTFFLIDPPDMAKCYQDVLKGSEYRYWNFNPVDGRCFLKKNVSVTWRANNALKSGDKNCKSNNIMLAVQIFLTIVLAI